MILPVWCEICFGDGFYCAIADYLFRCNTGSMHEETSILSGDLLVSLKKRRTTVKIQYLFNSPPKLIMLDDEGQHKETIRIDNWKREHILQFLKRKVQPNSASS